MCAGDREGPDRTAFHPVDPLSSGLTTALSWGEDFATGSTQGRVVVYADVATAKRRIEGHPTNQSITTLAALGHVLLVGSREGVHRSTDTLQSAVLASAAAGFQGVNQLQVEGSVVYAASDSGLFASRDSGATWERLPTPRRKVNAVALWRDTLFLATETGLYRSGDDGAHWTDPLWPAATVPRLVASGDHLHAATQTELWRTGREGPWEAVHLGLAGQYLDVAALGRTTWIASYWGVAVSEEGSPWSLARTSFAPSSQNIQALATDGQVLLGGTDTRGAFASWDRGRTWTMRSPPFHYGGVYGILATAIHDNFWYAATSKGVHRSADSGVTWEPASDGLPTDATTYGFFAQGARLWIATSKGPWFTEDHGATWKPPGSPAGGAVYDLAANRSGLLFAATDTGLQKAAPPYTAWTPAGLPLGTAVRLGARGDTLYVSGTAGPWRSVDGGATWTIVKSGLPGSYLQRILPGTRQAFAADGMGQVFSIGHADSSWQSFQGNLPEGGIDAALLLNDTVYLASRFRGMYRRALPGAAASIRDPARRIPSRPAVVHDAAANALRIEDPAQVSGIVVRVPSGRAVRRGGVGTDRLSLAGLPPGLYAVSVRFRDGTAEASVALVPRGIP